MTPIYWLKVEDSLIEQLGKEKIQSLFEEWLSQYKRRIALQEAADELATIQLTNDPQWQMACTLTWETYKQNFEK